METAAHIDPSVRRGLRSASVPEAGEATSAPRQRQMSISFLSAALSGHTANSKATPPSGGSGEAPAGPEAPTAARSVVKILSHATSRATTLLAGASLVEKPLKSIMLLRDERGVALTSRARRRRTRNVTFDLNSEGRRKGLLRWLLNRLLDDKLPLYVYWQSLRVGLVAYVLWDSPYRLALSTQYSPVEMTLDALMMLDVFIFILFCLARDRREAIAAGTRSLTLFMPADETAVVTATTEAQKQALALAPDVAKKKKKKHRIKLNRPYFAALTHGYLTSVSLSSRSLLVDALSTSSLFIARGITQAHPRSQWVWFLAIVVRFSRVFELASFFREKELDFHVEMKVIAMFKFMVLLYGSAHWLGCIFYFLSNVQGHNAEPTYSTFSVLYSEQANVGFDPHRSPLVVKYLVCLFKGFNIITAQNYEQVVPETYPELVYSIIGSFVQILVASYILGTITNYLVKKDAKVEANRRQLLAVDEYCVQRALPADLCARLRQYFEFQQLKQLDDDVKVQSLLPRSLQMKVSRFLHSDVLERNGHLFAGCNAQFLNNFLVMLREVHLMPGEVLFQQNDHSRELAFVTRGILEEIKDAVVIRLIRAESEQPSVTGDVAFFMGLAQPYTCACQSKSDATCLSFGKEDFDKLVLGYPEQQDVILSNLLATFQLEKDGTEMVTRAKRAGEEEDEEFAALRAQIRGALLKRNADTLAAVTYAASEGDVDAVRTLLKRGLPIDSGDYDGRTTLHLAAVEGNLKVVECLIQEGANVNVKDRWGQTPLQEAVRHKHGQVVEFLSKAGARLDYEDPAAQLCAAASEGDIEQLKKLLDNGINPDLGDYDNRAALHLAASEGNVDVLVYLVSRKADINVKDRWGGTPLEDAIRAGHELLARIIFSRGGRLPSDRAGVWLCRAAAEGDVHMVKTLLTNGCDVGAKDYDLRSPLHRAAAAGHLLVVDYLIYAGHPLNVLDRWGRSAMAEALVGKHRTCAVLIQAAGGTLDEHSARDKEILATLSSAPAIKEARSVVRLLKSKVKSAHNLRIPRQHLVAVVSDPRFSHAVVMRSLTQMGAMWDVCTATCAWIEEEFHPDVAAAHKAALDGAILYRIGELVSALQRVQAGTRQGGHQHESHARHGTQSVIAFRRSSQTQGQLQGQRNSHSQNQNSPGGPGALHRSGVSVGQSGGPSGGTPAGVDHELLEGLGVTRAEPKTRDPAAQRRERRRRRLLKEEKGARFHSILLRIGGRTTTLGHQLFIVHRIVSSPELVGASAKVGAVFDHLGLYQEDFRTVDAVAAMVNDGSHDGVAMNLLLTSSEFLRVLEEGTKRESATAWTGFRKLTAADDEEEMDEEGDPTSRTLRVRCMRLLSAINTLNELFEMFDPDMHDKLSVSVVESLCESVGDLGRSIVDEMYAYIDEQETMGINVEGVDRIAFFSHFLRATGIMDDAANADEASVDNGDDDEQDDGNASVEELYDELDEAATLKVAVVSASSTKSATAPKAARSMTSIVSGTESVKSGDRRGLVKVEQAASVVKVPLHVHVWRVTVAWLAHAATALRLRLLGATVEREKTWQELLSIQFDALDTDKTLALPISKLDELFSAITGGRKFTPAHKAAVLETIGRERTQFVELALLRAFTKLEEKDATFAKMLVRHQDVNQAFILPEDASPLVISPSNPFLWYWNRWIAAVGVWLFLEVPFRIAFDAVQAWGLRYLIVMQILDGMLLLDMVIKCSTAYINTKSVLVSDLKEIRTHYFGGEFRFDVIPGAPLDLVVWASFLRGAGTRTPPWSFMAWLRLPKMLRIWRVQRDANFAQRRNSGVLSTTASLLPMLLGVMHVLACALWLIGRRAKQDRWRTGGNAWFDSYIGLSTGDVYTNGKLVDQYVVSFFWVSTVMSTTSLVGGSPDTTNLEPANMGEVLFTCLVMVMNLTIFSYLLGKISDAVMEQDAETVVMRNKIMAVEKLVSGRRLPNDLAAEIRAHFQFIVTAGKGASESEDVFGKLSHSLKVEVASCISRGLVESVSVFRDCHASFLDSLSVLLREASFSPEVYIYLTNEVSRELYLVAQGSVELTTQQEDGDDLVAATRHVGEAVGELAFFFGIRHPTNARASSHGMLMVFVLRREDYQQLAKLFPDEDEKVTRNALSTVDGVETRSRAGTSEAGASMASSRPSNSVVDASAIDDINTVRQVLEVAKRKKRIERIVNMVSCAAKGDLDELRRILTTTDLHVDEGDYDERTALHLAASEGILPVVQYLVQEAGANMDVTDRYGNTPLVDSIRHKHDAVVVFLQSRGSVMESRELGVALCDAAAKNDVPGLQRYFKCGVDPNQADYDRRTALHLAASNGCMESLRFLLSCEGINHTPEDRYLGTPLQDAVRHGNVEAQALLLAAGSRLGHMEVERRMCAAAAANDLATLQTLHRNGAAINSGDYMHRTPLHVAASNGCLETVSWLLTLPEVNVNAHDRFGFTPLDDAVREGQRVVSVLLETNGALRAGAPALAAARAAEEKEQRQLRKDAELERANTVFEVSTEAVILLGLPELQTKMKRIAGELRSLAAQFMQKLRAVCFIHMEDSETLAKQMGDAVAGMTDMNAEQAVDVLQKLLEQMRVKAAALTKLFDEAPAVEARRSLVVRHRVPEMRTHLEHAVAQTSALLAAAEELFEFGTKNNFNFVVLRRDLHMRIRATRTGAAATATAHVPVKKSSNARRVYIGQIGRRASRRISAGGGQTWDLVQMVQQRKRDVRVSAIAST